MSGEQLLLRPIAHIRTDFGEKFGVPRQSGLVEELTGRIVFCPEFRDANALRGIEGFERLWLIWHFSQSEGRGWSALVRPPRLGGNAQMGVFATRAPFRPNPIGLSCVRLLSVEQSETEGSVLIVSGADMVDNTPILDIKPYLPYADSHPEAASGFVSGAPETLSVDFPQTLLELLPKDKRAAAIKVLSLDPRPAYQRDPGRVYGLSFAGFNLRFSVEGKQLSVRGVNPPEKG